MQYEMPDNDPREVRMVRADQLIVSPEVQRKIKSSREPKINTISVEFDWNKLGMIEVRENGDGTYRVTKGQGRTLAVQRRNPEMMLWAMILDFEDDREEAEVTLAEEDPRSKAPHQAAEKWRLRVVAADPRVMWAVDLLGSKAISIDTEHPRDFSNVTCVSQLTNILRGPATKRNLKDWSEAKEQFRSTFDTIRSAYPEHNTPNADQFAAVIVEAVSQIFFDNQPRFTDKVVKTPVDKQHHVGKLRRDSCETRL